MRMLGTIGPEDSRGKGKSIIKFLGDTVEEDPGPDEARRKVRGNEDDDDNKVESRRRTKKKETNARIYKLRRGENQVTTVENGTLLQGDRGPRRNGRAPDHMSLKWQRRDGIITPGMADPNRNIIGYKSQEDPMVNARTSGVFWNTSKTRDNRRFPRTAEKTL